MSTATDDYEAVYHRYEPHRAGLPAQRTYWRELWKRREFATEMSKAGMRGANSMTFFGQAWLVINPLLLAIVYYFIVNVLSNRKETAGWEYFSHLTGGLFVFYYFQGAVNTGASSPSGSASTKSRPCATSSAAHISSSVASALPYWRLLRIVPLNR